MTRFTWESNASESILFFSSRFLALPEAGEQGRESERQRDNRATRQLGDNRETIRRELGDNWARRQLGDNGETIRRQGGDN